MGCARARDGPLLYAASSPAPLAWCRCWANSLLQTKLAMASSRADVPCSFDADPSAPAACARDASSLGLSAEYKTTRVSRFDLIMRQNSSPCTPGIRTSETTTLGSKLSRTSTASSHEEAVSTTQPRSVNSQADTDAAPPNRTQIHCVTRVLPIAQMPCRLLFPRGSMILVRPRTARVDV